MTESVGGLLTCSLVRHMSSFKQRRWLLIGCILNPCDMMQAKLPSNRKTDGPGVVVNTEEPLDDADVFSFHDPRNLCNTDGMTVVTEQRARELGAVPCGKCFREQDSVQYDFPYVRDGGLLDGV